MSRASEEFLKSLQPSACGHDIRLLPVDRQRLGCRHCWVWLCSISWCANARCVYQHDARIILSALTEKRENGKREGRSHEPLRNSDNRHLRDFDRHHAHGWRGDPAACEERMCCRSRCCSLGVADRGPDAHGLAGHSTIHESISNR